VSGGRLLALALLVSPCGGPPEPAPPEQAPGPPPEAPSETQELAPSVPRVLSSEDRIDGAASTARPGDWLLTDPDGRVRFVVSALDHREGFHATGGNLLDVSLDGREDRIDGLCTWFERTFPRQAAYSSIEVDGDALVATGVDSGDESIAVVTRYEVVAPPPGVVASLAIRTTATAAAPVDDYDLGDIIGWGGLRHFAPGPGFALKGKDEPLRWLGAEGPDHALLLVGEDRIAGPHGASWSDPVYGAPDLQAGVPVTYARTLHVGETLAGMLAAAGAERPVRVEAREAGGTEPVIPGASFELSMHGKPFAVGQVGDDGTLLTRLPRGVVRGKLTERGRTPEDAELAEDADTLVLSASPPGRLEVTIREAGGDPIAGRLTLFGRNDTPDPDLGPASHALGGNRANLTGPATLLIPPGDYRVVASRGPTWTLKEARVTVGTGPQTLELGLEELVPLDGWLQCDLHQHAAYSSDSAIPPVDGVIASAAEGLDCIATTEHDAVADWTEHIEDAAVREPILWLSGIEVTNPEEGHYNVYPYGVELGVVEHRGLDPAGITARIRELAPDAVLQVNHPRYGRIGVFERLVDPGRIADLDHDAIEVLNGKATDEATEILDDVTRQLGRGKHRSLVGASDSHHLVGQERGSARTYVEAPPTTDGVARALRETRQAVATNGPMIHLTREGDEVVARLEAAGWLDVGELALYAGPFGRAPGSLPAPVATWTVTPGAALPRVRKEQVRAPATPGTWYLAVARGTHPMEPWLDSTPWAATVLVLE